MDLIGELAGDSGMATIFITHDLALAAEYCDRIVVMHAGHIVEAAPARKLFVHPRHPYSAKLLAATPQFSKLQIDSWLSPDLKGPWKMLWKRTL